MQNLRSEQLVKDPHDETRQREAVLLPKMWGKIQNEGRKIHTEKPYRCEGVEKFSDCSKHTAAYRQRASHWLTLASPKNKCSSCLNMRSSCFVFKITFATSCHCKYTDRYSTSGQMWNIVDKLMVNEQQTLHLPTCPSALTSSH